MILRPLKFFLLVVLSLAPVSLCLAQSLGEARSMVQSMEREAEPAESTMDALIETGIQLPEATALAIGAAETADYRVALAEAALCLARGETEFETVGNVAIAAAGEAGADDSVIDSIAAFRPGGCSGIELQAAPPGLLSTDSGVQNQSTPDDVSPSS